MLGLIVQLIISWILIWLIEKRNLSVLGLTPTRTRILQFAFFLVVTALCCAFGFFLKMYFGNQRWSVNPLLDIQLVWKGIYWTMVSVLFEELIFRGVLLYVLIKRFGSSKGILISAMAFGIYHWFSFGVLGNPTQMLFVFLITGAMGLVLAYGYAKTLSLYLPIGIHFGWNITQMFIFSEGPIGNGVFISQNGQGFRTESYVIYFLVTFLPLVVALLLNFLLIRKLKPQAEPDVAPVATQRQTEVS